MQEFEVSFLDVPNLYALLAVWHRRSHSILTKELD